MRCHRISNTTALIVLSAVLGSTLRAQQTPPLETSLHPNAEVRFAFERPGLSIPKFSLGVSEDGTGTYTAQDASSQSPQQIRRELTLSAATTKKIFALTHAAHISPEVCASKAKNIADTGKKTITYTVSSIIESCTYNYSDNKNVQALTEMFQGIAETMDMGRRLDFLHRFDRLGLNDAISSLDHEVSAGQAVEIGTIASSLRSIASDAQLMQRVRTRANALLALIPGESPQSAP